MKLEFGKKIIGDNKLVCKIADAVVSQVSDSFVKLMKQISLETDVNTQRISMSEQEKFTKSWANHSAVSATEIAKGQVITANGLTVQRLSGGVLANRISDILVTLVKRELKKKNFYTKTL